MITLSICMIVRDEEPVLERILKKAGRFADEIIVVDTGSKDRTKEIAARFTEKLYDFRWIDDFSAARNFSFEKAACDYIMWLDADDDMEEDALERLAALKRTLPPDVDVVHLPYQSDTDEIHIMTNQYLMRDRIIRRSLGASWTYPIHEAILIKSEWKGLYRPDIPIFHRKAVVNEPGRNLRVFEKMLSEGREMDLYHKNYYCRELATHGRYREAAEVFCGMLKSGAPGAQLDYSLYFFIESMKKLKLYDELESALSRYAESTAPTHLVCCGLGDCFLRKGNLDEAELWYRKALHLGADIRDEKLHFRACERFLPCIRLSRIYDRRGDAARADAYFLEAEKLYPSNPEVLIYGLYLAQRKERSGKAAEPRGTEGDANCETLFETSDGTRPKRKEHTI